jgi:hypothetical protein
MQWRCVQVGVHTASINMAFRDAKKHLRMAFTVQGFER